MPRRGKQNHDRVSGKFEFPHCDDIFGFADKKDLLEVIPGYPVIYKTTAEGEIALESLKAVEAIYS